MSTRALFVLAAVFAAVACGRLGALKTERFACNTSGDCADGYECLGGECALPGADAGGGGGGGGEDAGEDAGAGGDDGGAMDAGPVDAGPNNSRDAGAACTNSNQCLSGLICADGVCCTTACNAPCDSCNQVDNLGTCLPRPAGSVSTTCGLYTCDGTSVTCPTTCDPDGGVNACAPAGRCEGATCLPCWSGVTEAFTTASSAWVFEVSPPATAFASANLDGGRLVISVQARPNSDQAASATSAAASGLGSCGVSFELVTPPVMFANYVGRALLFRDNAQQVPHYGWTFDARGLVATWALGDGGTGSQVVVSDGGYPRWLRVEELAGEVHWRTTSGTTFTTVHTVTHDGDLSNLKLRFDGAYPAQGGQNLTYWVVDNVNRGP